MRKIGETVEIRSAEYFESCRNSAGVIVIDEECVNDMMLEYAGKTATIITVSPFGGFYLSVDIYGFEWTDGMLELEEEAQR